MATLNPRLEPFYKDVTAAIRGVDPGRVVILAAGSGARASTVRRAVGRDLAYTYHSFWASTKRDSIERHLNFSARDDVPLFLGENGELTYEWNVCFRSWTRRWHRLVVLDRQEPRHALDVVSIPRLDGWTRSWPSSSANGRTSPTRR